MVLSILNTQEGAEKETTRWYSTSSRSLFRFPLAFVRVFHCFKAECIQRCSRPDVGDISKVQPQVIHTATGPNKDLLTCRRNPASIQTFESADSTESTVIWYYAMKQQDLCGGSTPDGTNADVNYCRAVCRVVSVTSDIAFFFFFLLLFAPFRTRSKSSMLSWLRISADLKGRLK